VTVTIHLANGQVVTRCVLVADTDPLRQLGLMGVTDATAGGYDGMLFVFSDPTTGSFWMKDTLVPLSIAFLDPSGAFISRADMVPCPVGTSTCPLTGASAPYVFAIEVPAGSLETFGLTQGAVLDRSFGSDCHADPGRSLSAA